MFECKNNFDVEDIHNLRVELSKKFENMTPQEICDYFKNEDCSSLEYKRVKSINSDGLVLA